MSFHNIMHQHGMHNINHIFAQVLVLDCLVLILDSGTCYIGTCQQTKLNVLASTHTTTITIHLLRNYSLFCLVFRNKISQLTGVCYTGQMNFLPHSHKVKALKENRKKSTQISSNKSVKQKKIRKQLTRTWVQNSMW